MKRRLLPTTLGLAHGVAGLLLGRLPRAFALGEVAVLVLLYNVLAFGAQPLVGLLTDHLRNPRLVALAGLGLLAAWLVVGWGGVLVAPPVLTIISVAAGVACLTALTLLRLWPRPAPLPEARVGL